MFTRKQGVALEPSLKIVPAVVERESRPAIQIPPDLPSQRSSAPEFDSIVVIGRGTRIIGEISDCTTVDIQGVLEGKVVAESVIVREGGGFQGTMRADTVQVFGVVEGNVIVNGVLDVHETGQLNADTVYGQLTVAPGGTVQGSFQTISTVGGATAVNGHAPAAMTLNGTRDLGQRLQDANIRLPAAATNGKSGPMFS